jgi:hypothetical protein
MGDVGQITLSLSFLICKRTIIYQISMKSTRDTVGWIGRQEWGTGPELSTRGSQNTRFQMLPGGRFLFDDPQIEYLGL